MDGVHGSSGPNIREEFARQGTSVAAFIAPTWWRGIRVGEQMQFIDLTDATSTSSSIVVTGCAQ